MRGSWPESRSDAPDERAPGDAFEQAHQELLEDSSIQFELLPVEPPEQRPAQSIQLDRDLGASNDMGALPQILFWIVIGLAAAGLLYLIVARLWGSRRREGPADQPQVQWQIAQEPAMQLLDDADALAAQGRYSEAAHLLLHRSIAEIDRRRPAAVRKALTSRDIARLPAIPARPAQAFAGIVRAVERSLFAGRALDEADWRRCRDDYQRFAFAAEWQT
jgi:hypothetical protein